MSYRQHLSLLLFALAGFSLLALPASGGHIRGIAVTVEDVAASGQVDIAVMLYTAYGATTGTQPIGTPAYGQNAIEWGDGFSSPTAVVAATGTPGVYRGTFSHTYGNSGNYRVRVASSCCGARYIPYFGSDAYDFVDTGRPLVRQVGSTYVTTSEYYWIHLDGYTTTTTYYTTTYTTTHTTIHYISIWYVHTTYSYEYTVIIFFFSPTTSTFTNWHTNTFTTPTSLNSYWYTAPWCYGSSSSSSSSGGCYGPYPRGMYVPINEIYAITNDTDVALPACASDADCDNGLFCDGVETCDAALGCQTGTAVDCDDGVSCTVDACNESSDTCDHTTDDGLCDNGLFCDGTETCDAALGCQAGTPVDCDDGVSCTVDSCNEGTDSCDNVPITVPIVVDNFSFETPALADGGWTPTVPSWAQLSGVTGIFNPTSTQFPGGVPHGDNSAYSNGGAIGQTIVAETLLAATTYTLAVDVGNRADRDFPGYEIQLLVGGVVRASADETSVSPADGTFATATASFTTMPADVGQSVEIRLLTSGEQPNFDNVRLTRSACGGNWPPVVTITSPSDGSSFNAGASVSFAGSAADADDGDLGPSLSWTSSVDGAIGSGAAFSTSGLSVGNHTITASVTDSGGLAGSDSISITVVSANTPPVVTIESPADGSSVTACDTISFAGSATDAEDGDLSAVLSWISSLDGAIGAGASFSLVGLSAGSHTITASAVDSGGLTGADTISITVTAVSTEAIAVDNFSFETPVLADGGWTPTVPSWAQIAGVTGIFNPTSTQFPGGVPHGDNSAYSNGGSIGQTIVAETLLAATTYTLAVDVGNRADRDFPGYEIQLLVDGVVRASADETSVSPADGTFATARASFATLPADVGQSVEIRLVTPGPQPNFDNVRLTRSACGGNSPPVVTITSPGDGASFNAGTSVSFAGTATDAEDGDLGPSLAWTSNLDGAIGSGVAFSTSSLSCGAHTITASVTDSGGFAGSAAVTVSVGGVAMPIAVENFSFETPALADGGWTPIIPSWVQLSGAGGVFDPTTVQFPAGVPDGDNSAYLNGGAIGQTIAAEPLLTGTTYRLSVDVGNRADRDFPRYEIQLLAGGVVRASADETSVSPANGTFATATASFTTMPADTGQSLEIRLLTQGAQPNFDNVRLTRSACGGNSPPVVTITSPSDGSSFGVGASISFAGTATDVDDGDLGPSLAWTSSLDGAIGSGVAFSTSSLSCGVHTITASVTDSGGLAGSAAATITVSGGATTPIAVENFSFETPALADGGWTPSIPSWAQISGVSGIFDPTTAQFPAGVPDGDNSAYLNGGSIGQTIVAEPLFPDTIYTLSVDVGDRADRDFPGYEIQLLVDDVVRASADETSVSPANGIFATATASFTTMPADVGQSVEIRLLAPGEQPNFDNVRLTRAFCN